MADERTGDYRFVHLVFHFEYTEIIEEILDQHDVGHFVRYPMMEGKDRDGKHFGNQVYPGNCTVVQATVKKSSLDALFDDLRSFKEEKNSHQHLQATVLSVYDLIL